MRRKLELLVIHCTATPEGREVTSAEIHQWHRGPRDILDAAGKPTGRVYFRGNTYPSRSTLPNEKIGGIDISKLQGRGWRQVGYSDIIHLDGMVENLVPYNNDQYVDPWEMTNGVASINAIARHVVYAGGTEKHNLSKGKDTRTQEQRAALSLYVIKTLQAHPSIYVAGHNQFDKKFCPSFNVPEWCRSIGVSERNIYTQWPHGEYKEV